MTGVFDNALKRRFTDSPVLVLANVDGVDVLLIHNGADGLVYRIQASMLASFINAAQQTALNAKANKAGETFTGPVVLNYATPLFTAWNASATSWGGYEWKQGKLPGRGVQAVRRYRRTPPEHGPELLLGRALHVVRGHVKGLGGPPNHDHATDRGETRFGHHPFATPGRE